MPPTFELGEQPGCNGGHGGAVVPPRQRCKVAQQGCAVLGRHALWVEQHAIVRQAAVRQAHQQLLAPVAAVDAATAVGAALLRAQLQRVVAAAGPGDRLQAGRQAGLVDQQGVVPDNCIAVARGHPIKQRVPAVPHRAEPAVHRLGRVAHRGAMRQRQSLEPQAHAEHRDGQLRTQQRQADACAGAGDGKAQGMGLRGASQPLHEGEAIVQASRAHRSCSSGGRRCGRRGAAGRAVGRRQPYQCRPPALECQALARGRCCATPPPECASRGRASPLRRCAAQWAGLQGSGARVEALHPQATTPQGPQPAPRVPQHKPPPAAAPPFTSAIS